MNANEIEVARYVRLCRCWGNWPDEGRWVRVNGRPEYWPTRQEIATKCKVLRERAGRQGAHARAPRGGEFAVVTLAGI